MTFDPSNLPPRLNLFCIFCCAFPLFVLSLSFSLSQCHLQSFSLRSLSDAVISSIFHKPHVPIFTDHSHLLFNSIKPPQASTPLHLTTQNKNPTEKKAVLKTFCLLLLIVVFPMDESQQPQQTQTQTQTQIQTQAGHDHGGISGKPAAAAGSSSNYLCRQSSTRWTPTTDQIKILKDLYYNSGVRSPTTDQIQKISARLRQFGKIEGKNVFYWFQNHKARERQKKRFTSANTEIQRPSNIIYPNFTPGISCPSSASGIVGGCGYGHMSMETGLRECEMPACGNGGICSYPTQGFQWTGVNHPYLQSYYSMESTRNQSYDHEDQFPEEDGGKAPGLETLPLFPVHAGSEPVENYYTTSCHWFNAADTVSSGRASLELRLNSYGDQCPNY